jgi:transcriptional regulator of acetoin/glycerol metabolism
MKRAAALYSGEGTIHAAELLPFLSHDAAVPVRAAAPDERAAILAAYERAGGNKSRLAELLGVSRKTLYARLKRLGIALN